MIAWTMPDALELLTTRRSFKAVELVSVGRTVDLSLIRGGTPVALKVVIGERPVK
jgi:hypothetical protein